MQSYRRIMALVDLSACGRETARIAWAQALKYGARYCLGHIIDWDIGTGGFSPLTPPEIEDRLKNIVRRKLLTMAEQAGALAASVAIGFKNRRHDPEELIEGWQPDLLVVNSSNAFGMAQGKRFDSPLWSCDVQVIEAPLFGIQPKAVLQSLIRPFIPGSPVTG